MGRVGFQLLPQSADMDHKGVIVPHQRPLPEGRAEGIHRDNVSPGFPQLFQKGIFLGGKGDLTISLFMVCIRRHIPWR